MEFPEDQITELQTLYPGVKQASEGDLPYFLIPSLTMPDGCTPMVVDALLCPCQRDGYVSRLFFSQVISAKKGLNWNSQGVRIVERNWNAYSLKVRADLRLAQMVSAHLAALR